MIRKKWKKAPDKQKRERAFIRRLQPDSLANRGARRRWWSTIGKERKRTTVWKQLTDDI